MITKGNAFIVGTNVKYDLIACILAVDDNFPCIETIFYFASFAFTSSMASLPVMWSMVISSMHRGAHSLSM